MENRKKVLAMAFFVVALVLGASSSLVTARFFYEFDETWFRWVLVAIGLSIDFGKFGLPAAAAYEYERGKFLKPVIFAIFAIICIGISFMASQAYDANKANESLVQADGYKQQQTVFKTNLEGIERIKKDIADLKANRAANEKKIIDRYKPLIETSRKLDMLTIHPDSVAELSKRRDKEIAALDTAISAKENELSQKEGTLAATKDIDVATVKTTRGIYALAAWINPKDPAQAAEDLSFWKNLLIEIIAIVFSMAFGSLVGESRFELKSLLARKRKDKAMNNSASQPPKIDKTIDKSISPEPAMAKYKGKITAKRKNKIGFQHEPKKDVIEGIDNAKMKQYIELSLSTTTKDGDKIPGYTEAKGIFGSDKNSYTDIRGYLKTKKLIDRGPGNVRYSIVNDRTKLEELYGRL